MCKKKYANQSQHIGIDYKLPKNYLEMWKNKINRKTRVKKKVFFCPFLSFYKSFVSKLNIPIPTPTLYKYLHYNTQTQKEVSFFTNVRLRLMIYVPDLMRVSPYKWATMTLYICVSVCICVYVAVSGIISIYVLWLCVQSFDKDKVQLNKIPHLLCL